jgi:hypothetical protein
MLQLLGYSTEDGKAEKGISISNSEFCKLPNERNKEAFTQGAVKLGLNNEFSLLSTVELYEVIMLILQNKLGAEEAKKVRDKIMSGAGIVHVL